MTTSYQDENFILQYSPRTSYSMCLDEEEQLYKELKLNFDPITIKIIKKHFKEQLGMLSKENFIAILKNHLLAFQPTHPQREKLLIRLLSRLFSDIDLNDKGQLTWNEFTDYIIHFTNTKDKNVNNKDYRLKFYSPSSYCIKHNELTEMISYAFFIEKYNVIGVVQEGKSTILFFDVKKYTKIKCYIDIKEVQGMVDVIQFGELSKKAERIIAKEEESKKINRSKLYAYNNNNSNKGERKKSVVSVNKDNKDNKDNSSLSCSDDDNIRRRVSASSSTLSASVKANQTFKSNAKHKLGIICTVFIPEYDILLIAGTNNTITAWYFNGGEVKNVNTINDFILTKDEIRIAVLTADSPQYSMIWDSQLKHLYTGQRDGRILKWDLTKPTHLTDVVFDIKVIHTHNNNNKDACALSKHNDYRNNTLKEQLRKQSTRHQSQSESSFVYINDKDRNESVSCLLLLTKLQLLAASYYSGYIILWDTLLRDYRKCYCDQSTGVYAMAFDSHKNLLFTCGFDHNIYVYDPYIDGTAIYKLTGHSWSLNSIDVNEKESELISLDILGNIKVWDTQAFISFQNIKLNEECVDHNNNNVNASIKKNNECSTKNRKLTSNIKMLYIKKYKKIFIYGTKLISFETNRTNYPELADDQVICACYYDKITKTLFSFCLKKIKIWNILTGKVKQIYDDPMGNEITAVIVDKNVKRGFIGDNTGKIKNINLKTGNAIKELTPHTTEIKFICHSTLLNIVVSCSIDNVIKIHNDKELLETELIKELSVNQFQIRAICIVERFSRLAIGLSNGVVKFYDIEHFHYDSDLTSDNACIKDEVSALSSVNGVELVLCCYCKGLCKFMITPPSTAKFAVLYEFTNTTAMAFTVAVVSIEFDEEGERLFIGDALGYITCIDVSQLYKVINTITHNEKRKFDIETIITKENVHLFSQVVLPKVWYIEAHKESIKHLHYIDIEPQVIISTSHDLRIKAFAALNGEYKDEFKQSANNYKSIPIGIKYYLLDPFGNNNNNDDINNPPQPYYYSRKDINGFTMNLNNENEYQQITEYSKKITEYNAKEKLYLNSRNVNCPFNMSNNWLLDINVDKVLAKEENEFKKLVDVVTKTERITKVTEYILQHKSIYCESYNPKYIEEMNDFETIKKYSRLISERLRHVKMAVSKANLNQCKMKDLMSNSNNNNKQRNKRKMLPKSKSALNLSAVHDNNNNTFKRNIRKGTELSTVNVAVRNDGRNVTNCSYSSYNVNLNVQTTNKTNYVNTKSKLINGNRNIRQRKHRISTMLNRSNVAEHFYRFKEDFDNGFKQMIVPFKMLIKKSKNKNKKNLLLPNIHSTNNGEVNEHKKAIAHKQEERRKRFASMEHELQKIEQDYYY